MKFHYFMAQIDNDLIKSIAEALNQGGHHTIFLSSGGGGVGECIALKYLLEGYNKQVGCSVIMVFNNVACSAAFDLLLTLDKSIARYIPDKFVAMVHLTTMNVTINSTGGGTDAYDDFFQKRLVENHQSDIEWLEGIGISPKDIALVTSGKNVYLMGNKLERILRKNKIQRYLEKNIS